MAGVDRFDGCVSGIRVSVADRVANAIGKHWVEKRQQASRTTEFWQPNNTPGTGGLELSLKARVRTS